MEMGIWSKSCVSDKCFAGRNHHPEFIGALIIVLYVQQVEPGNITSVRKRLHGWKQAVPSKVAKTPLDRRPFVKTGDSLLNSSWPDMTTVFHPWTDYAFVKIEDSSWGQKSLKFSVILFLRDQHVGGNYDTALPLRDADNLFVGMLSSHRQWHMNCLEAVF